ncbi:hydrogenase 3 maturation endopeptidase HyCI [Thermococcus peptonophilus]|uniref:Hydrogenase 3 maturation endopeptidase HyCI n=1 Tax=Thermococcus peptonophilus TaxID=53952 RepID=A0A142CX78_9EURY|nr:hydrogenase 3 maturation endopeptidase HyCI [Thermococcus peptonophilus]AMQ19380.1 hydrogenase 3 maturation endopeptidase HyCI [Thermococcus peptonophilus]
MNALEEIFSGKKRIVICGIGNDIRGDDAFGVLVAERLKGLVKNQDVLIINCGEVPENYTSKIAGFEPDLVVFVDAVDFKGEVGEFIIADPEGTLGEAVSTHGLPLKFVTQYMKNFIKADFALIGCQPGSTGLFEEPSELIRERAERLAQLLAKILEG